MPRVDGQRLVLIGLSESSHRAFDVGTSDSRKLGAEDLLSPTARLLVHATRSARNDLEANVFTFTVAIQPEDEVVDATCEVGKRVRDTLRFNLLLHFRPEQPHWGHIPALVLRSEVCAKDVAGDRCHNELGGTSKEGAAETMHRDAPLFLELAAVVRQHLRDAVTDGWLFSHHQYRRHAGRCRALPAFRQVSRGV